MRRGGRATQKAEGLDGDLAVHISGVSMNSRLQLPRRRMSMLLRRVWPSRPAFDNPFADFGQLRREMQRMFEAFDGVHEPQAGVFPPMNVTQDNDNFCIERA